MDPRFAAVAPIGLLALSATVMNVAWYWHLKTPSRPLLVAVALSWLIALGEYALMVPANRIGAQTYSLAQLKTIAEVCSLVGFVFVAWVLFGQKPVPSQLAGFALIAAGAVLIFRGASI
jgi:uncharacterized protein (DUF486 family)